MRAVRTAAVAATVAGIAGLVATATPAFAMTPWEPGGYSPTCATSQHLPSGNWRYTDTAAPLIDSVTTVKYVKQYSNKVVAPRTYGAVTVRDRCSGLERVRLRVFVPPGFGTGNEVVTRSLAIPAGQVHSATVPLTFTIPWNVYGKLLIQRIRVTDRLDSFDLNPTKTVVVSGLAGSRARIDDTVRTIYVLRNSNIMTTTNIIPAVGSPMVIRAGIRAAFCDADCGYIEVPGVTLKLQWRGAADTAWTTIATGTTDAQGKRAFTVIPPSFGEYRVVHSGAYADPWTAPSISPVIPVAS